MCGIIDRFIYFYRSNLKFERKYFDNYVRVKKNVCKEDMIDLYYWIRKIY